MVGLWSEKAIDVRVWYVRVLDALDIPILFKRNTNQYIAAFFHLFDFTSDIAYILTVPIFSNAIYSVMVATMVVPAIPLAYMSYLEYKKKGDDFYAGFMMFCLSYIGIYDIYANKFEDEPHLREASAKESARIRSQLMIIFAVTEDVPQFSL